MFNQKRVLTVATASIDRPSTPDIEESDEIDDELKAFLQSCVLPVNKNELKNKLSETKECRRKLILNDFEKYQAMWNFYFVCPDLVSEFRLCSFFSLLLKSDFSRCYLTLGLCMKIFMEIVCYSFGL